MPEHNPSEPLPQIHIPGVSADGAPEERICVHHVFIIDGSGSMRPLRQATITGFNEQVQNIRQLERNNPNDRNLVTLVVFNGLADVRFFDTDSNSLQEITEADYSPDGSTALYGTVGEIVTRLKNTLGDRCSRERVIITIMTDGHNTEFHSQWNQSATAELLQQVQSQFRWVVTFIGANINVAEAASALNIPVSNTVAYLATADSTRSAFAAVNEGRTRYMAAARSRGAGGQSVQTEAFYSADLSRGLDLRHTEPPDPAVASRRRLTPEERTQLSNLVRGVTTTASSTVEPVDPVAP